MRLAVTKRAGCATRRRCFGRRFWVWGFGLWALAGCGAGCPPPHGVPPEQPHESQSGAALCQLALVAGPGDGSYVPGALEATATAFLGPAPTTASPLAKATPAFPRLRLDRATLTPGSGTAFGVTRNQTLGLRAQISQPLTPGLRSYAALGISAGQHDFALPRGIGPLIDPMRFSFQTRSLTAEAGVIHDRPLPALSGGPLEASLRLRAGAGVVLTQTRTRLTSALLDVTSQTATAQPYVSLGAGVALRRGAGQGNPRPGQLELIAEARLSEAGQQALRLEARLSH